MATRYPHELYLCDGENAILGTTGNWSVSDGEFTLICSCREEPNNSGKTIVLNDGSSREFSSMIYLPVDITDVDIGAKLQVKGEDGTIRFTGEVMRFSNDRKHSRIWA